MRQTGRRGTSGQPLSLQHRGPLTSVPNGPPDTSKKMMAAKGSRVRAPFLTTDPFRLRGLHPFRNGELLPLLAGECMTSWVGVKYVSSAA